MTGKILTTCATLVLFLGAADVPAELQGEWKAAVLEKGGKRTPDAAVKAVSVVIKGDTFALKNRDTVVEEVTLKADPTKSPKQISITPLKGPRKGKEHLGIYSLEGGQLKLCWAVPGNPRPTGFTTTPETGDFLLVLDPVKR